MLVPFIGRLKVHCPNVGVSLPQKVCDQMPSNDPAGATDNNFCIFIHSEAIGLSEYRDPIKKNPSCRSITSASSSSSSSNPAARSDGVLEYCAKSELHPRGG